MFYMMMNAARYCRCKVETAIGRTFNEENGLDGIVVALILLGVALILGFAFKNQLQDMVEKIWNELVKGGNHETGIDNVAADWSWG